MNNLYTNQFYSNTDNNQETSSDEESDISTYDDVVFNNLNPTIHNEENREYEIKLIEKTNYLVINSKDRDWSNFKYSDTFNYYSKFNPIGDSVREYKNINLEDRLKEGSINQNDYNKLMDSYKLVKGQSDNLHLKCNIRNIKDIELTYCILPNIVINPVDRHNEIDQNSNFSKMKTIKDLPYIHVELLETDGIWDGTNDNINKSIGIMIPDDSRTIMESGNIIENNISNLERHNLERASIIFRNIDCWKKTYHPNPKNNLNLLSIRFLDPYGNQIKLLNDKIQINNINFEKDLVTNELKYIRIITNYFTPYEYKEGDNIILKDIEFNFNIDTTEFNLLNLKKYLQREEGHKIIIVNRLNTTNNTYSFTDSLCNALFILFPYELNLTSGVLEKENFVENIPFNDILYNNENNISGNILNLDLQHTIFFKVTSLYRDIDFNSKIL